MRAVVVAAVGMLALRCQRRKKRLRQKQSFSGYQAYKRSVTDELEAPGKASTTVGLLIFFAEVGKRWSALPDADKVRWNQQAAEEKKK